MDGPAVIRKARREEKLFGGEMEGSSVIREALTVRCGFGGEMDVSATITETWQGDEGLSRR